MVCDICHKNHATIHLTEIVNDEIVEMHICQECAQSKAKTLNEQLHLSGFLGGLAATQENKGSRESRLKCSFCGFRFQEFKTKGRLGCGVCYSSFRQQLIPLIKKIHGSVRHVGKVPAHIHIEKGLSFEAELKELRLRLERAIQLEEYEEAARLRDEIRKLERK